MNSYDKAHSVEKKSTHIYVTVKIMSVRQKMKQH